MPMRPFPLVACAIVTAVLGSGARAQAPRFADVGTPLPAGMGQLAAAADVDADGDLDLFTSTGVFVNTGGFFRAGPALALGPLQNVRTIEVADLTGDGRADVLAGHVSGPTLYVAPAFVTGGFAVAAGAFPGAAQLSAVCVADVDGDGDRDVFAARPSTASTDWRLFFNGGTGVFTAATSGQWAAATSSPGWIGAGDFDGDGDADAIAVGWPNGAEWRRNLGGGSFGPSLLLGASIQAERGAIGDFDGDGTDDVFLVATSGMVTILAGSPAGLLAATPAFGGIPAVPPLAVDLDGDQRAEVVHAIVPVSGGSLADVVVRFGTPAGLGPALPYRTMRFAYGSPVPFAGLAVADLDLDGDRDVVLVPGAEAPSLLVGSAAGYLPAPQPVPAACGPPWVPLRDVDGDGDPDLLRADIRNGLLELTSHRNDGRGNFAATPTPAGAIAATLSGTPAWCDLDGDGDEDLWLRQWSGSHLALMNDGTGVFTAGTPIFGALPTSAVAFGDFDGDLDVDVVVSRGINHVNPFATYPPVIHFAQATPTGMSYSPALPFGTGTVVTEFVVIDVDADADLDLVFTNGSLVSAYVNDGTGGFTPGIAPPATAATIAAGDVDGDTLPDLVLGHQTWRNGGGSTWIATGTHVAPIGRISLADVDGDGDLDLLDSAGRWYAGDNTGAFAPPQAYVPGPLSAPVTPATATAHAVDVDGDGDVDLLAPQVDATQHAAIRFNLTRHAGRASLMSQGTNATLAVHASPTTPWFLAGSQPTTVGVSLPPFGTLFLDPGSLVVAAAGVTGAAGRSDVLLPIPAGPAFAGVGLSWQALTTTGLTNGFDTFVLP
jgi:hypothetical protein